jgi:hypothetical protein
MAFLNISTITIVLINSKAIPIIPRIDTNPFAIVVAGQR